MSAHQWRPIRGRRFDPYRFIGFLICTVSAVCMVLLLWAVAAAIVAGEWVR